jgi:hypothetical protein
MKNSTQQLYKERILRVDTDKSVLEIAHARHHEIYLSDPRRVAPERLKTILRHPVRKKQAKQSIPPSVC